MKSEVELIEKLRRIMREYQTELKKCYIDCDMSAMRQVDYYEGQLAAVCFALDLPCAMIIENTRGAYGDVIAGVGV